MKVKHFKDYLEKRLNKQEIKTIEKAAALEFEVLKMLQQDIAKDITNYMSEHDIGFNAFSRRLGKSPSQVSRMIKGEANLTLATIAQIYALIGRKVHIKAV